MNFKAIFTYEDDTEKTYFYNNKKSAVSIIEMILNAQEIPREGALRVTHVDLYSNDKLVQNIPAW
ncbi:hypothetical protein [Desulfogranum mediterraneum]|uniref:hypothetical protein n=1 Tax=Desulfogranum mediterraneum TaxID=160661 RepID=UPI0004906CA5|nr:hypothetical protein [Desulfogranum mediterraneum]